MSRSNLKRLERGMICECEEKSRTIIFRTDGEVICCLCGWPFKKKIEEVDFIKAPEWSE